MKNKFSIALTLALTLALIAATFAFADNLLTGGDGLVPVVDTQSLDLGNVCLNSTTSKPISHAINKNGGYPSNNVFQLSTDVAVSVAGVTGAGLSAGGGGTITIPSNWDLAANNTLSPAVSSNVTFVANSLGNFSGIVNYDASGTASKADNKGNTSLTRSDSLTVTANVVQCDITKPTLHLPDNMVVEATSASGEVVTFIATADDANPVHPLVTCTPASGSTFALDVTKTVNCSATDAAGNTANGSFTVEVVDTTPPDVIVPSSATVEAVDASGALVTYSGESASDLVDGDVDVSCDPASGSTFPLGETAIVCTATDGHENTGTNSFTITVEDTTGPVLLLPDDMTEEATGPDGAAVEFSASASDVVDGDVEVACVPPSGSIFEIGTTEVECSASDTNGNSSTSTFNVTVQDKTAPTIEPHNAVTEEATSASGAAVSYTSPATSDVVDGARVASCTPASGSVFALGTSTVSCEITDAHGNKATSSFEVNVVDTTPPDLTLPADQQLEATGPGGAATTFAPTATDLVDGSVTVSCDADSGDTFPLGTTTVKCSAIDAHNNKAEGSFVIIVEDTTAPVIAAYDNITKEATGPNGAVANFSNPSASDIVDTNVDVACEPASGNTFALGHHTVTCTATDDAGNTAQSSFDVYVQDTTAPTVAVPANLVLEATGADGAVATFTTSANDIVDGALATTCSPASGSTFALGTTTVNCSATDKAGNLGSDSFTVKVQDTTKPALGLPSNIVAEATGPSGAVVTFNISANDLVDGAITPSCSASSGSTFALGTTTVNCSATDNAGNAATGSFSVTVQDTKAPVLSLPGDMTVSAVNNSSAVVSYTASALDVVDGAVTVSCLPTSGSTFLVGTTTVNCSATDAHNNTAIGSFKVNVVYNWAGFFQPIDNNGVFNVVKSGSTVPVKFSLGGDQGLAILATGSPTSVTVACPASAPLDAIEETSTATVSGLKYDALANQYIYNWKTLSTYVGSCRQLTVKFADGSVHTAFFKFVK